MEVTVEMTATLRAQDHGHQPLIFDARGNGGGGVFLQPSQEITRTG